MSLFFKNEKKSEAETAEGSIEYADSPNRI